MDEKNTIALPPALMAGVLADGVHAWSGGDSTVLDFFAEVVPPRVEQDGKGSQVKCRDGVLVARVKVLPHRIPELVAKLQAEHERWVREVTGGADAA